MFRISVLGPLEVRCDGHLVAVPGGKTAELLVRLALDAGVLVRTDRLVLDLWAGAVSTRRNTLQSKVTKLRRALGGSPVIVSANGGYTLDVQPADVDALVVVSHAATAGGRLHAGDNRGAAELCGAALAMYRGDVLPSAGDGDWVYPQRAQLEEVRQTLVETSCAARFRLEADVTGELEAAVATYPLREGLWELLMTTLYRAGRQADALAAYQRVKAQLADALGLDPGPHLQQLEQQILTHDASLGQLPRTVRACGPDPPAGNLPTISAGLVGRDIELAALTQLFGTERLVEIVGPGGVGKTALAVAAGRTLGSDAGRPGGIWLVRLETAVTASDVLDALIAAMNVTGGEAALLERLKGGETLVILDNCEHVIDAAVTLAIRLLDANPGLQVLCTSQVALDVDGEAVFELAPLALADAVQLFLRRAAARRGKAALSQGNAVVGQGNAAVGQDSAALGQADDAVHALCRSLDGLPLAIELAAARTTTLSTDEIIRRLDDRFTVLTDPTSRRPDRRRALKETIRWSYDLLFPDDQRGLWALATFAGGASLPAVEYVLAALDVPAATAIDVVGRLAHRSLLIVDGDTSTAVRYRLLDSIRAFALAAMADVGLTQHAFDAQASWFADAAEHSTPGVRSSRQADYLAFARTERANIDAALTWTAAHDPLLALRLVNGFGWAWVVLGDSRGAQRIGSALLAAGEDAPGKDRATGLLLAAWIEASTGNLELARDHIAAAIEVADALADAELQARCCYYLAYVISHSGEFSEALELTDRSRALYDRLDRPWDQAANGLFAARAAISAGNHERAVEAADRVLHWLAAVDDPWLHVRGDAMLGELARIQHRFDDAIRHVGRAATTSQRLGFLQTEAYQLSSLGRAQCQAGNSSTGLVTLELAIDKAEATGDVRLAALARVHLGRVRRALGDWTGARAALDAAAAWHRAAGGGEQAALGECLLAALDAEDRIPGAEERLHAILDVARANGDSHVEVFALDSLARIAAEAGDLTTARGRVAEADRRMAAAAHFITQLDRVDAAAVRQLL